MPCTNPAVCIRLPDIVHFDEQLAILRALEAGEIDVDEAAKRLAGTDPHA